MQTIIISDLHLGSDVSRADKILSFLDNFDSSKNSLVLNGDIFDNLKFNRLKKSHWKILKKIRHLSNETNVVWVYGNHDRNAEVIAHLIGIKFVREHIIEVLGKKIIITHGDQFDAFIEKYPISTKIADNCYRMIQKFDRFCGNDYLFSKKIKRSSKTFLGASETLSRNAREYCKNKNCHAIICGHTHKACDLTNLETGIQYSNSGCWTEAVCHYVLINEHADIKLCEYKNETKNS